MARTELAPVVIRKATWHEVWPAAEPLMRAHWEELRAGSGPLAAQPFEVDVPLAQAMDGAGILVISAAWDGPRLVGYCFWYRSTLLEAKGVSVASHGPWYVAEPYRNTTVGLRLYRHSKKQLEELGVCFALPHHWELGGGERLGEMYRRDGAVPLETVWIERLGQGAS